jgi:hypothetical protein
MDGGTGDLVLTRAKRQALIPVSMEAIPDLFAAQHAYTMACDGFHPPGPCPPSRAPVRAEAGS